MAHQSSSESDHQNIPSLDLNTPHPSKDIVIINHMELQQLKHDDDDDEDNINKDVTQINPSASETLVCNEEKMALQLKDDDDDDDNDKDVTGKEDSGRERLKLHRVEVAGNVWIPEIWGQEELLKDWIDCTAFDAPLLPTTISTARQALVQESTRSNAARLRIDNRDLDFNVHMDLSLNNNCTNVEVQNTGMFSDTEKST